MDDSYLPALSMAALELLPAQSSDLNGLLADPASRNALLVGSGGVGHVSDLLDWLLDELEPGRVEFWYKRIERIGRDLGAYPVLAHEDTYPRALRDCWDAPPVLFVRGHIGNGTRLAIVGSRQAEPGTLKAALTVARAAAKARVEVVSGLAAGVDTAAHRGALDAGGRTVAVMGTGIRRVFPADNLALADEIAGSGALVSQFAPDAPRTGTTFLYRNSVIAGLAGINLVMSGEERSGSRHQAEQAMRYVRTVLLWAPTLESQRWACRAVDEGAARFVSNVDQVAECLSRTH